MNKRQTEFSPTAIGAAIAAACGATVSIGPIVASTFGIFLSSFTRLFGWSRAAFSVAVLICALVGALVTPFAGRAIDRWGIRRVMLPAVALFGLSMMSVSLIRQPIWELYLAYGIVGITAGFQNMVAYSKVVSAWFTNHRGLVLSLVTTCYGIGYALVPKLVQPLIATHGWQAGYLSLGGVVLAALVVLVPFLRLPSVPASSISGNHELSGQLNGDERPLSATRRVAIRDPSFWILMVVLLGGVTSLVGIIAHLFPMMTDRGYSARFATTMLSVFAFGAVAGQLCYGVLVDRLDSPKVGLPFFLASLTGVALLSHGRSHVALMLAPFLMGIGQGSELGLAAYFTGRYFGVHHLGEIYGYLYAAATVASGLGPVLMGYIYDHTGSYQAILAAFQCALFIAVVGIWSLRPYRFTTQGQLKVSA